jgi:hypothetical protein
LTDRRDCVTIESLVKQCFTKETFARIGCMNHFVPSAGVPAIAFIGVEKRLAPLGKSAAVLPEGRVLHDLPGARHAAAGGLT